MLDIRHVVGYYIASVSTQKGEDKGRYKGQKKKT